MSNGASFKFDDIEEGLTASFEASIDEDLVSSFAALSGDYSPLHVDDAFARGTPFGQRIPHGMIAGAFFSRLVGMHLPGTHALYLSQELSFKRPLPLNGAVTVRGTVTGKSESTRTLTIKTDVVDKDGSLLATGEAVVRVLQ